MELSTGVAPIAAGASYCRRVPADPTRYRSDVAAVPNYPQPTHSPSPGTHRRVPGLLLARRARSSPACGLATELLAHLVTLCDVHGLQALKFHQQIHSLAVVCGVSGRP